jgi:hypothetical protein
MNTSSLHWLTNRSHRVQLRRSPGAERENTSTALRCPAKANLTPPGNGNKSAHNVSAPVIYRARLFRRRPCAWGLVLDAFAVLARPASAYAPRSRPSAGKEEHANRCPWLYDEMRRAMRRMGCPLAGRCSYNEQVLLPVAKPALMTLE